MVKPDTESGLIDIIRGVFKNYNITTEICYYKGREYYKIQTSDLLFFSFRLLNDEIELFQFGHINIDCDMYKDNILRESIINIIDNCKKNNIIINKNIQ